MSTLPKNSILAQHGELARCIFLESNDAFLIFDPDSRRLLDANPTALRLLKKRRKEILDLPLEQVIVADIPQSLMEMGSALESTGEFHSRDGFSLLLADGQSRPVNLSISRIHLEQRVLGLVVARDMTKQRLAEERLQDANQELQDALERLQESQQALIAQAHWKAKAELAAKVAHELNNALVPVLSFSELLEKDESLGKQQREYAHSILSSAENSASILKGLLLRFRGERVKDGDGKPIDLGMLINETVELVSASLDDSQEISFSRDIPSQVFIPGSSAELGGVLLNVLINAADSIAGHGHISVALTILEENSVVIEICDDGCGMTDDELKQCTQPFFSTKSSGTGLGLAIVEGAILRLGGQLSIQSDIEQGTTVSIRLPLSATLTSHDGDRRSSQAIETRSDCLRILYVDDEAHCREAVKAVIGSLSHEVVVAASGHEALSRLDQQKFDLVITDLVMPHMNGAQLTLEIRRQNPEIPVVVATGCSEQMISDSFFGFPEPTMVLSKPLVSSQLSNVLESISQASARRSSAAT